MRSCGNDTTSVPWEQVLSWQAEIERIVGAAVARGTIAQDARGDAVQDAMLRVPELWARYDPTRGPFKAYFLQSIHTSLLSRRRPDALDRSTELTPTIDVAARPAPAETPARPTMSQPDLARVPRGLQVAARMLLAGVDIGTIARRTGRDLTQLKRQLRPWRSVGRPRKQP